MARVRLSLGLGLAALGMTAAIAAPPAGRGVLEAEAQLKLHQSFANLQFQDFGPAPVKGPIYQAIAGGRLLYFAPDSGHLLFAAVYNKDGVNLTALAESEAARRHLSSIDPAKALALGPPDAPTVIEFTDPACPYCRALEKFWAVKLAEGVKVRRLIYFVSSIHPEAAALAEHILCSTDKAAAFHATYAGTAPATLAHCPAGHEKVASDAALVGKIGVTGTPTLILDGKLVSGFQQGEIEAWLDRPRTASTRTSRAVHGGG